MPTLPFTGGFGSDAPTGGNFTGGAAPGGFGALGPAAGIAGGITAGIGSFIQGQATSAGDLAMAQGYTEAAQQYTIGERISLANEKVAGEVGRLTEQQITQQVGAIRGTGFAIEGAGGAMAGTGSGLYIARNTAMQGALARGIVNEQANLQIGGYAEQAAALKGEAEMATATAAAETQAASAASTGGFLGALGGLFQAGAAAVPLFGKL